jgi:hypothetical protein
MIEIEVAKPFKILSAYLITAAITRPPKAFRYLRKTYENFSHSKENRVIIILTCKTITVQTIELYP